jgi:hypothetical protein
MCEASLHSRLLQLTDPKQQRIYCVCIILAAWQTTNSCVIVILSPVAERAGQETERKEKGEETKRGGREIKEQNNRKRERRETR